MLADLASICETRVTKWFLLARERMALRQRQFADKSNKMNILVNLFNVSFSSPGTFRLDSRNTIHDLQRMIF